MQARQRGLTLLRGAGEGPDPGRRVPIELSGRRDPVDGGITWHHDTDPTDAVPVPRAAGLDVIGKTRAAGAANRVVALSVDNEATTAELIAKHGLEFGVGYGADARALAAATGAFVNYDPLFLQSTGFVLNPAGQVAVGVYSTGAIGRVVPEDVIGLIRYLRAHAA